MTSSLTHRLESWRAVLRDGGPDWIVEQAPKVIGELEAMIAAQADRRAMTTKIGMVGTMRARSPKAMRPHPRETPNDLRHA